MTREEELVKEYLDNPSNCPFCGSGHLITDHGDFGNETASRDIRCGDCGKMWTEEFQITNITFDKKDL